MLSNRANDHITWVPSVPFTFHRPMKVIKAVRLGLRVRNRWYYIHSFTESFFFDRKLGYTWNNFSINVDCDNINMLMWTNLWLYFLVPLCHKKICSLWISEKGELKYTLDSSVVRRNLCTGSEMFLQNIAVFYFWFFIVFFIAGSYIFGLALFLQYFLHWNAREIMSGF